MNPRAYGAVGGKSGSPRPGLAKFKEFKESDDACRYVDFHFE